jgi:hypothetical protein
VFRRNHLISITDTNFPVLVTPSQADLYRTTLRRRIADLCSASHPHLTNGLDVHVEEDQESFDNLWRHVLKISVMADRTEHGRQAIFHQCGRALKEQLLRGHKSLVGNKGYRR